MTLHLVRNSLHLIKNLFLLPVFLLISTYSLHAQEVSTQGTEFYTVFMTNGSGEGADHNELSIIVSAKRACTVSIQNARTSLYYYQNQAVPANGTRQFVVSLASSQLTSFVGDPEEKGLRITSSDTVSVFTANYGKATFDGSGVLPVGALGSEYMIHTAPAAFSSTRAIFAVTAVEEGTTVVDVYPSAVVKSRNGQYYGPVGSVNPINSTPITNHMLTLSLLKGQSFQLGSETMSAAYGDLSGTRVSSRDGKKIAVINGTQSTQIPIGVPAADHIYDPAFPLDTWGKKFILTGTMGRCKDMVRITASEDNTSVYMNGSLLTTLSMGQTYEGYYFSDRAYYIESSKPVAVYSYITSVLYEDNDCSVADTIGDPSMVWISPIEQKVSSCVFSTFMPTHTPDYDERLPEGHYVNVITPTASVSTARMDNQSIASYFSVVPGNTEYSYAQIPISHGIHSVSSQQGLVAHVYGTGWCVSYAYNVGSTVKVLSGSFVMNGDTVSASSVSHYCIGDVVRVASAFEGDYDSIQWSVNNGALRVHQPADTVTFVPTRANIGNNTVGMKVFYHTQTSSDQKIFTATHTFVVHDTSHTYQTRSACENYYWNGQTFTQSGIYTHHTQSVPYGCDSVVTLTLTINHHNTGILVDTACDRYSFGGRTYTSSTDNATTTLTNHWGCDSVVTLHLTIKNSTSSTETIRACNFFEWHGNTYTASTNRPTFTETNSVGCDSVVTLNLTILYDIYDTVFVESCDSYEWRGETYTASTTDPRYRIPVENWCDTVRVLGLTIYYSTPGTHVAHGCTSYEWHDSIYTQSNNTDTYMEQTVHGCDSLVTLDLTIHGLPIIRLESWLDCPINAYHIIPEVGEGTDIFSWTAMPTDKSLSGQEDSSQVTVSPQETTTYQLYARMSQWGCENSDEVTLEAVPNLNAKIKLLPQLPTIQEPEVEATNHSTGEIDSHMWLLWDDSEHGEEVLYFNYPIAYDSAEVRLVVYNDRTGCTDTASEYAKLFNEIIWAANVFTPEMESNNRFRIMVKNVQDYELFIYNRRGQMVFHTEDISEGWDGCYKGTLCDQDSYVYHVIYTTKATPEKRQDKKGTVTLLR